LKYRTGGFLEFLRASCNFISLAFLLPKQEKKKRKGSGLPSSEANTTCQPWNRRKCPWMLQWAASPGHLLELPRPSHNPGVPEISEQHRGRRLNGCLPKPQQNHRVQVVRNTESNAHLVYM